MVHTSRWLEPLRALYGAEIGQVALADLVLRVGHFHAQLNGRPFPTRPLTERDVMLMAYGDQVRAPDQSPLQTLAEFCDRHVTGLVNSLHLLPFYPASSGDGFAVMDYRQVDPSLGSWENIAGLQSHFHLMFDAVINHVSAQSAWFRGFLRGQAAYRDDFIRVEGTPVLTQVARPHTWPPLTGYGQPLNEQAVWTTFSPDQIDLNYRNPQVLLEIIEVLLFYVARGAEFLRLDAVAYLWKEIGTTCVNLPQTHQILQLLHALLEDVAPHVRLIAETNIAHTDNVTYFGDGTNEAHLVSNFALPPLVLHTFYTGSAKALTHWASHLTLPSDQVTFFNFLASQDGIGLDPVRGLLSDAEFTTLVQRTFDHGGQVSFKLDPHGWESPYELNINYFDALSNPAGNETMDMQVARFMAAQAILLALAGLPGIYFHSLFGSRGWREGMLQTGDYRTINRQKLNLADLEAEVADRGSRRHQVFSRYAQFLKARARSTAFHPHGAQHILDCGEAVFALVRVSPTRAERVLCLINVSEQTPSVSLERIPFGFRAAI